MLSPAQSTARAPGNHGVPATRTAQPALRQGTSLSLGSPNTTVLRVPRHHGQEHAQPWSATPVCRWRAQAKLRIIYMQRSRIVPPMGVGRWFFSPETLFAFWLMGILVCRGGTSTSKAMQAIFFSTGIPELMGPPWFATHTSCATASDAGVGRIKLAPGPMEPGQIRSKWSSSIPLAASSPQ